MSCPSWPALIDEREHSGEESPALRQALVHLESCRSCREEAYRADPLLLFRRLPQVEVGDGEVESMQRAVATLRRASEVGKAAPAPAAGAPQGELLRVRPAFLKGLAAASLLFALTWAPSGLDRLAGGTEVARPAAGELARFPEARRLARGVLPASLEDLDLPEARVYELSADELQLVMIVDPSLNL